MQQENAIRSRAHAHTGRAAQTLDDLVGVGFTLGVEGDITDDLVAARFHDVDGAEVSAFFGQQRCQPCELSGLIRDFYTHGHAVIAIGLIVHDSLLSISVANKDSDIVAEAEGKIKQRSFWSSPCFGALQTAAGRQTPGRVALWLNVAAAGAVYIRAIGSSRASPSEHLFQSKILLPSPGDTPQDSGERPSTALRDKGR